MAQDELQLESARHNYPAPRLWHRSSLKNSTSTPIKIGELNVYKIIDTVRSHKIDKHKKGGWGKINDRE